MTGRGVRLNRQVIREYLSGPDGPVTKDLARRAIRVERRMKQLLSTPGQGVVYQKYSPRRAHRASAPGQPPAPDTGRLRSSVTWELRRDSRGLHARIGTNVEYAEPLEFGTEGTSPRPFMRRSLDVISNGPPRAFVPRRRG